MEGRHRRPVQGAAEQGQEVASLCTADHLPTHQYRVLKVAEESEREQLWAWANATGGRRDMTASMISPMSAHAREAVIRSVMAQHPRRWSRKAVEAEYVRQVYGAGFVGETVEEVVGQLAHYLDRGGYDQRRLSEAERLGIRVETLDVLVEEERAKLEMAQGGITGADRRKAVARMAGMLFRRVGNPFIVQELTEAWAAAKCPSLPSTEVRGIIDFIAARELQRLRA
jgi:hypothetical protein